MNQMVEAHMSKWTGDACANCDTNYQDCTQKVFTGRGACCSRCAYTDTHNATKLQDVAKPNPDAEPLPVVNYKGPYDTDEAMFMRMAWNLEHGYEVGGSNVRDALKRLIYREVHRASGLKVKTYPRKPKKHRIMYRGGKKSGYTWICVCGESSLNTKPPWEVAMDRYWDGQRHLKEAS